MECGRGLLSSFFNNTEPKKSECLSSVSGNGSKILEELTTSWNGKDNVSAHVFSAEELIKATNNFDSGHMVLEDAFYSMYRGSAKKCPILIKKYGKEGCFWSSDDINSYAIRDIVITSQICGHKNVLKFIGCCLELQFPALVYEYEGRIKLLSHGLHERDRGAVLNESLSWKSRLSIANDIASALVYLLTAFPTPIVHRNLKPSNFIIDQGGVAKLLDFSLSISIPPGESQVQDKVVGTYGFAEPEYTATGILTAKTDVYGFGMILLELLTGQRPVDVNRRGNHSLLDNFVKDYVDKDQLNKVVDPRIMAAGGGIEQDQQFRAFAALALRCTLENRENRPGMIDVAEELRRIQRAGGQGRVFCGQKYTRFMACRRGMLSSILKKKKHNLSSSDQERNFLENGSMLLEDLVTFSNGRYNIPIGRFSVKELSRATNGFCSDQIVIQLDESHIYKSSFEERLIFIKKYDDCIFKHIAGKSVAIRNIVVVALMSSHKNALKLMGCCLDFEIPALVRTGSIESLGDCLYERGGRGMAEESIGSLTWKSRLKIANDIAYAVVYMHTAFPTPIIHRPKTEKYYDRPIWCS